MKEAKQYSFYDVLEVISIPQNEIGRAPVSEMHVAAVALAASHKFLPLPQHSKVLEELMEAFDENEWGSVQFFSQINVTLGEPRSSPKKAIVEATEHSEQDGQYGFVIVPVNRKFPNGDHQFIAAWFEKLSKSKIDGTLN